MIDTVYRVIVIAKLTYASSAWWGFATAADWQRLEAAIRSALCDLDQLSSLTQLVAAADDDLFFQVVYNDKQCKHMLSCLLPTKTERTMYQLRNRRHNRSLVAKVSAITESDFIMGSCMKTFTDFYVYFIYFIFIVLTICTRCGLSTLNKDDDDDDEITDMLCHCCSCGTQDIILTTSSPVCKSLLIDYNSNISTYTSFIGRWLLRWFICFYNYLLLHPT